MSAFIVSEAHIDYIVRCAVEMNRATYPSIEWDHTPASPASATLIGQSLWRANIASVAYRYSNCSADDLPGPVPTPQATDYRYINRLRVHKFDPVQLIKAVRCYQYQSCERPEWEHSAAYAFCDQVISKAISMLPGYDQADWEIAS